MLFSKGGRRCWAMVSENDCTLDFGSHGFEEG